ncbi:MAG: biotin carboxylase N-terminal domain-containing protein [Pseudomonadota bacterium]
MEKLLIANRGEIACRIIATAKKLGIPTVAVFSTPDASARHVELADEAVHIGDAAPQASYLNQSAVLDAARRTGATAIHPGYGFLSENASFARACADASITFVGPPASAIDAMGSKSAAKSIMQAAGVPLLPGYHGDDQADKTLEKAALDIGYPVLLKATAGGGGKGMRIVESADEFGDALKTARQEAMSAFGDDKMLVEKYLGAPRHIEVQVFADTHGTCVHLHDRDCSIQRRYQKIIEEAPAPGLAEDLRERMGAAAIAAARAIDYVGAGTVEFLLEGDGFYFMEMNTRLQVEHPVTEAITGVDLVAWQLAIARGEALPLSQSQIPRNGHAIEARIYAEDADAGFLPTPGPIHALRWPESEPQPRIDTGVRSGDVVSIHYDPMIAKMVQHADTRDAAASALSRSLRDTLFVGLTTNVDFLIRVLDAPAFLASQPTTAFLREQAEAIEPGAPTTDAIVTAALALWHEAQSAQPDTPWHTGTGWWPNRPPQVSFQMQVGPMALEVTVGFDRDGEMPSVVRWSEHAVPLEAVRFSTNELVFARDDHRIRTSALIRNGKGMISAGARQWSIERIPPDLGEASGGVSDGTLRAPMTGRLVELQVRAGDTVNAGDTILVMEAMKMAHTLTAPINGTITDCHVAPGDLVEGGQVLVLIEPEQTDTD